MHIAVLSESDALRYRAHMLHAYEHAADAFTSTADERAKEPASWWVQRIADSAGLGVAFGAFEGPDLVGTVALEFSGKPKTRHKALVIGVYVLPALRGRGVARALMEAAIAHVKARGDIRLLQLEVTQGNEPALALYLSLGFIQFGLEPMAVLTAAGFRAKIHMALVLDGGADSAAQGMAVHPITGAPITMADRTLISSGSTFEAEIGYSRAVVQGDWVFVSGTTGFDYSTMTIAEGIQEQTEQCLKNISLALEQAGSSMADVVRATYVLPNGAEFPQCWPILRKYFGQVRPAAMMICAGLLDPRIRIEIEVTALKQS